GENYPFEATVMYKGQRLMEGTFKVQVRTTGTDKVWDTTLEDTGSNGDAKAGDGNYSGWFSPTQAGNYKCNFMLAGTVQGHSFSYETGDLPLLVGVRPEILIDGSREMSVGQAGTLQVQVESKAATTEDVTLGGIVGGWKIPTQTLYLPPGEKRIVNLVVPWDSAGKTTAGKLYLSGSNLRGQEQEISVYFRGPWQDIWYSHKLSITICSFIVMILCCLLGIGTVLFRYYKQALRLSGMLVIGQSGRSAVPRRLVPLQSFNKSRLTLGWSEGDDITLDLGERSILNCALVLEAKFPESVPNFLIGWLCLIGKHKPVTVLTSTGGTVWLKERTAKRPMVRSKTVLSDGDEVSFYGCKMLFRR
ncbi:MAG TPA: choice-of-anchor X domain-containing protein, partial [Candidatus Deferrimicrobium sp.]|nr:choice-of-anchor X domain-containing protein [Candidatus Deferrimicrobium sp.]